MAMVTLTDADVARVEQKVRELPLPKGVRFRRAYYSTDSTGDDAIYVVYSASRKIGTSKKVVDAIGDLRDRTANTVNSFNFSVFPYVLFEDAA